MEFRKYPERGIGHILSIPVIYLVLPALLLLDITVELYHRLFFPVYGLRLVKRSQYIKFDRHKLKYLNWYERINCLYCGYANGLLPYASRIAAETEKYWCGIKHQKDKDFKEPKHHKKFLKYGDEKTFKKKYGYEKPKK